MRIVNNLMAMNAHRQLMVNQGGAAKSIEKLSSGLRINRAGDDAAGLAISEKMRGQIRGLKQAVRNAQDAISLIQTAEGALTETHAILQRMRELAAQSATDTNTAKDREEIQKEIDQLAEELTRIANTTEFNTQNLLGGDFKGTFHIGANEGQNISLSISDMSAAALGVAGDGSASMVVSVTDNFDMNGGNASAIALAAGVHSYDVVELDAQVGATQMSHGLADSDGNIVAVSSDGVTYTFLQQAVQSDLAGAAFATEENNSEVEIDFGHEVTSGTVTVTYDPTDPDAVVITASGTTNLTIADNAALDPGTYTVVDVGGGTLELHNEAGDKVGDVSGSTVTLYGVTLLTATDNFAVDDVITINPNGGIDVMSQEAADEAITVINDAIESVSAERSKLGAMQNRLEHTIANLGTSAENLQAAESRIRDVDMAAEMMAFTKFQILQQASTAMLAQANMAPQSVLQLLG